MKCSVCRGQGFEWKPVSNIPDARKGEKKCTWCGGSGVKFNSILSATPATAAASWAPQGSS
jgi:hypothetical protein